MVIDDVLNGAERKGTISEPDECDVSELSNFLGCSESDAAKLIKASTLLRVFYERECSVEAAHQHHKFSKKILKEYIETRLDVAGDLVPYFNGDPRGPSVKVMAKPDDGEIDPFKPWEYVPNEWPFIQAMSNEAFIPSNN